MHRHPASTCHAGSLRPLARALAAASLLTLGPALGAAAAQALPGGLRVVSGQAQVNIAGQAMTITNSSNAILNWQSFNIGAGNSVRFQQPGAASQVLNRVTGNDPSNILGNLSSNGRVWLINQNGVLFGRNARVDVAGLVTSTLAVNDKHWLVGTDDFATPAGAASASVTNLGELRTPFGGRIALLGGDVRNDGLIETPGGQVLLAAGRSMDLVDTGAPNLTLHVSAPSGEALNLGTLSAPGGRVDVQAAVVNQQGIVRADAIGRGPGGTLMLQATQELTLAAGSTTQADGGTGTGADAAGGRVTLAAGDGTALVAGNVSAVGSAGKGGTIELLGRQVGVEDAGSLDASGARGGGSIFMGGGASGQDASIPNAQAAYVAPGATLRADALDRGDGGRIVLWSDAATRAYGSFSAQGGRSGGDGGSIETSGGWLDARPANVSAAAPAGRAGRWLLDPNDISIEDGDGNTNISGNPDFTTSDDNAVLGTILIENALNRGNNVTITTGSGGGDSQSGNIVMSGATISVAPREGVSLSLNATQDILFNGAAIASTGAQLAISLNAGTGGNFGSIQLVGSTLTTAGGNINLGGGSAATGQRGTAPFHGAVGHDSGPNGVSTDNGVALSGTTLSAGSGDIAISGSTASGTTSSAYGVLLDSATLSGRDIDILGWVDGIGQRNGVEVQGSTLTGSHSIAIDGTALSSWATEGVDSNVSGVRVYSSSLTVQPDGQDTTASLSLLGTASVTGSPTDSQKQNGAYVKFGVDIQEDETHAIALNGGGSIAIRGSVDSDYAAESVYVSGPAGPSTTDVIEASGAASLAIAGTSTLATTQQSIEFQGAGIAAPNGGRLSVTSDGTLTLVDADAEAGTAGTSIHGAPAAVVLAATGALTLSGSTIALTGASGQALQLQAGSVAGDVLSIDSSSITSTNPVQLYGNAVSLTGATVVSSSATGDAIVLAGGGTSSMARFTNTAGAGALLTPNGRWLTYASDRSTDDWAPGALAEDFTQYEAASPETPAVSGGNGFLFALTPGVVLGGNPTRAYDGTTAIALSPSNVQPTGLVAGDSVTIAAGAVGNFDDKNVGTGKTIVFDADALSFVDPNGKPAYGYSLGSLLGSITPKTLTIGAITADNRAYDGTRDATIGPVALQGLVGNETLGVNASGTFDTKDAGTDKLVTVDLALANGSNGGLASNYTVTATTATTHADITPKTLTIGTITADSRAYDGTRDAAIGPVSLQGLVGSETLTTQATGTFDTKDAGTDKLVTVDLALANGTNGGLASNYTVTSATATTHADITPKTLTIGTITADNRAYDGTRDATIGPVALQGLVGSETLTTQATGTFDTKDAGTDKLVTVDLALANGTNGGLASNYTVTATTATTHADITPKTLTIGTITADSRAYDGTRDAAIGPVSLQGLVGSETLTTQATGTFDTKDAGTDKLVTVDLALANGTNGGLASNYTVTATTATTHADITPKTLTIGTITADNRAYDGSRDATIGPVALQGLVGSETLTTQATGTFDTKDAATDKLVTVDLALANGTNGGLASNYTVTSATATTHADITPKTLTIGTITADNRAYDGTRDATIGPVALQGLVGSETLTTQATGTFDTKDAGTDKPVTVDLALANGTNGGLASNYTVTATTATTHADITPKTLTVGTITADNRAYDGSREATIGPVALQGLVGSETLTTQATGTFDTKDAGTDKLVTVDLALANGSNGGLASNYTVTATTATTHADITPKTLTIATITADNRAYDGTRDATIGPVALQGLVGSETLTTQATGTFDTKDAGTDKPVTVDLALANGTNGGLASNYSVTATTATTHADITPKTLTIGTITADNRAYDGSRDATIGPVALQGLVGSETLTPQATGTFDTKDAGTDKPVTVDLALANGSNGGLASNYALSGSAFATTADITPRPLSFGNLTAADKVYDGTLAAAVGPVILDNLVAGEQVSAVPVGTFSTKDVGAAKPVTVSLSLTDGAAGSGLASNYVLTTSTGSTTASITPKGLDIAAVGAANKTYDGTTTATVTGWTLSGVLGSDQVNVAAGSASFATAGAGAAKPVQGTATRLGGADAADYALAAATGSGSADIAPAILTYDATPLTAVAGAAVPPLQGNVSGFVAGETIATATSGSLGWITPATAASASGTYAVNGSGLQAANYVFVQGAGNASALTLAPLSPTTASTSPVATALAASLQAVQVASSSTAAVASHVFDATSALQAGADGTGNFASLPLAQMSQESVAAILAARDAYKRDLFAGSIEKLQQTPSLADLPACQTVRQSETGECLTTLALTGEAQSERLAIARDGTDVEHLPPTAAGPATKSPTDSPVANLSPPDIAAVPAELPLIEKRQVRNAALPQIQRKIAIVIGVGEFQDKRIPELRNAVSDARSVAALLASSLGYETVVLPDATRKTVIGTLNKLAGEIGPTDSVIIYYAGHGELVASTGLGYWQLADADADKPETWLSNADIGRMLARLGASQVALVSDSCYSGSLVPDQRVDVSADRLDPGQVLSKRAVVVMSSGGNEPVFDTGKDGHSAFAASLMQTLEQVSSWQAGGNVFERVRFDVARQLPQRPHYGASTAAGHQEGSDYLFEQRQLDDAR